jgi:hypothetical protein
MRASRRRCDDRLDPGLLGSMCGKFTEKPDWLLLIMNSWGSRARAAVQVDTPSFHLSVRVRPLRPRTSKPSAAGEVGAHLEAGGEDQAVELVFLAVHHHAVLGDPLHALALVSTRCTLGRLKVGRYSSWKQGRLQNWLYQGFSASAVAGSCTTVDPGAHLLHLLEVGQLHQRRPARRRFAPAWPGGGGQQDVA